MTKLLATALLVLMSALTIPAFAQEAININKAPLETLTKLPGIGEVKAQAIIDDREANGPYESLEDLSRVDGIGDATVANLGDSATL